jgi:hypothetical protein
MNAFYWKCTFLNLSVTEIYLEGLFSARRTSVKGMSKLLRGRGLMAMIVLMMIETFRSLICRGWGYSSFSKKDIPIIEARITDG